MSGPSAEPALTAPYADLPLSVETPRLARLLGESPEATALALDAIVRAIAAGSVALAADPSGAARLAAAALDGPFDPRRAALDDHGGTVRVHGARLAEASGASVRLFGVAPLARLAEAVADGLPISPSSVARLPGVATGALLARWRESIEAQADAALDGRGLAALLAGSRPLEGSVRALAGARAAGWSIGRWGAGPGPRPGTGGTG
jgi:hypothetical protein